MQCIYPSFTTPEWNRNQYMGFSKSSQYVSCFRNLYNNNCPDGCLSKQRRALAILSQHDSIAIVRTQTYLCTFSMNLQFFRTLYIAPIGHKAPKCFMNLFFYSYNNAPFLCPSFESLICSSIFIDTCIHSGVPWSNLSFFRRKSNANPLIVMSASCNSRSKFFLQMETQH